MLEAAQSISLNANQIVSYDVVLCDNIMDVVSKCVDFDAEDDTNTVRGVFVDAGLPEQFKRHFLEKLSSIGAHYVATEVPGDEENKVLPEVLKVVKQMNALGVKRRSAPCIVIGGGVALDVVGFAASLYRCGVPYIRVPTTLLSMVDVGVAAKTAANYLGYKNRIGTFHPAALTLVFPEYLSTLPRRQISNGAGEIFKLAVIKDKDLFDTLDHYGPTFISARELYSDETKDIILRSLNGMAVELENNLWEHNLQRVVDYGHSFSPLVEMTYINELLHGEAVTLDCLFSAILSFNRGHLSGEELERLFNVANKLGLPTFHSGFADIPLLERALKDTTIHRNGSQNLPLMDGIGSALFVNDVSSDEIQRASKLMAQLSTLFKLLKNNINLDYK
ncbi:sedoheptulose 7-phosphate cyclase [Azorhizophilus paspali]|uniref:Sedoheptulose 7-phosphate cyclase n=1 Tax=Azorhizophilus paspali TaxID=69963 RepID=A0ABV6SPQ2_AZOPA